MKNKNYKLIIILSVLLVLSIIFMSLYNLKNNNLENLQYSRNFGNKDPNLKKYDRLNTYSCYVECLKNTSPFKCKYFTTNANPLIENSPGTCTLLHDVTNVKHSSTDTLYHISDTTLPNLPFSSQNNKAYSSRGTLLSTINNIHKETCDMECAYNNLCTSYTTDIRDNLYSGTCKLYNEPTQNNIINMKGSTLYTKTTR
jgi:hypothetical protein